MKLFFRSIGLVCLFVIAIIQAKQDWNQQHVKKIQRVCMHGQVVGGPGFFLFSQVARYAQATVAPFARPLFLGMFVFSGVINTLLNLSVVNDSSPLTRLKDQCNQGKE